MNRVPRALSARQNSQNVSLITFLSPMSRCTEINYLFHDTVLTYTQANFSFSVINPNFEIMYINKRVGLYI
jgi:hypothetical protein